MITDPRRGAEQPAGSKTASRITPLRIAQIPPLCESVPPKLYGGTERVVAHLCDALVELGHDVTLFSSADARTKARLVPVRDQAIRLDNTRLKSELAAHIALLHEVKRRAASFDILHFHLDLLHLPMFELQAGKCVTTLHGRLDLKDLAGVYERWPGFGWVSISNDQRRPLPGLNWLATVPHGLPPGLHAFQPRPAGDYLAFLGRMAPEKAPDAAIRLALQAGVPLKIAAKIDDVDKAYFESVVKPLLNDPLIEFVGEISDGQKAQFLGNARALLFPIAWPEPFGLVMIEAMACGTPVIALNCGSVPEVVRHGVSGYVAQTEADALQAIGRVAQLDRYLVRQDFEARFTARAMASRYLDVYDKLINAKRLAQVS